ncbi:DUF2851 family protein [uncultured Croceitalea sp.]|uniref:DUF2851 family protein n=1 Tax=uncultured Croceitalea sp. TaxID=1798908 RepID=UPI00374ED971
MREDLLHFIWKTNKLPLKQLKTAKGEELLILNFGQHNLNSGPDFFNAKFEINGQVWAGNVEMHLKASDWYAHGHETDSNYDNVILHVVWEDDISVFRKDNTEIPTLELKNIVPNSFLSGYENLLENSKKKFINCESDINTIDDFLFDNFLERLYIERLEEKSKLIFDLLNVSNNNWEHVLFSMLLKNFGSKVNGESFLSISKSINFSIVRKLQNNSTVLESVLLGMAKLLDRKEDLGDYYRKLQEEFTFQKNKFNLDESGVQKPDFFGLRPNNFPTIRLSQFSNLYAQNINLFSKVMEISKLEDFYSLFSAKASNYWDNHYTFGKESKPFKKSLTRNTIDLILINTLIPLKFAYSKKLGKDISSELITLMSGLGAEKNSVIKKFSDLSKKSNNAFQSQAKLQLYNKYCSLNHCLKCTVGNSLLNRNS